jgi:aldehyde dehydrogenase (NAD+)
LYKHISTEEKFKRMTLFTSIHFKEMQDYFFSGSAVNYAFRKEQLQILKKAIQKYEQQIMDALYKDLHKSQEEAFTTEIGFLYAEISHTLKNLKKWMQKTSVGTPFFLFPSSSSIIREPLGVCLIIAPWNYPFQLLIAPLIGAIAGGNCTVLKPSELTPHTSAVIVKMITEFFDEKYITVVEGDGAVLVPQMMNENRFDHVFFTGSIPVGREIAKMAAEKLVPVTLELGGKSPCVVDEDADIKVAAKRVVWGKFTNAGQTCVAPDYVLVHEKNKDPLVDEMQKSIQQFYGSQPIKSLDYGRIVNQKRLNKLKTYLAQGEVIAGGDTDDSELYFAPTLMQNIITEAPIMKEEIFGPILPIIPYKEQQEALNIIHKNPYPLSLYYFGNNKKNEEYFVNNVQFGGGCINNTLVHLANADLPFGGVGNSGVGAYHGKFSFDTFTRTKAILKTATWIDPSVKYPPYQGKLKLLRRFFN